MPIEEDGHVVVDVLLRHVRCYMGVRSMYLLVQANFQYVSELSHEREYKDGHVECSIGGCSFGFDVGGCYSTLL